MNTPIVITIFVALVLLGVVLWSSLRKRRSVAYQQKFGPEYERLEQEQGRHRAEKELEQRTRRVEKLSIRTLRPNERSRFADQWREQQTRFVDDPRGAVTEADRLVAEVMQLRGYPVGDFEQRAADVSVDHPQVVQNYRAAHDIALRHHGGKASTEDLRGAMIYYRALFEELLEEPVPRSPHSDVPVR